MFTCVVIGIKSGLPPEPLIDLACSVTESGGTIHLVSLIQVGRDEDQHARLQSVERELAATAATLDGKDVEVVCHSGIVPVNAGASLARYAEEHDAQLLVIGLSKRTRVGKALLGSDAQTALLSSPCPVLCEHVTV